MCVSNRRLSRYPGIARDGDLALSGTYVTNRMPRGPWALHATQISPRCRATPGVLVWDSAIVSSSSRNRQIAIGFPASMKGART